MYPMFHVLNSKFYVIG